MDYELSWVRDAANKAANKAAKEAAKEAFLKMAKKMLKSGMDITKIAEFTGLKKTEIEKLA